MAFLLLSPLTVIVVVGFVFAGFYYWAKREGFLRPWKSGESQPGQRRVPLLTEAVAYAGGTLILAGIVAAISERWASVSGWERAAIFAGAAAVFLLVGIMVRHVREPVVERLVGVVWFVSVLCLGGSAVSIASSVYGIHDVVLAVGAAGTVYAACLWLARRQAPQSAALFAGIVLTLIGVTVAVGPAPLLTYAVVLWGFGLTWTWAGWRRYLEPMWMTMACGSLLALIAPAVAIVGYGWVYAIAIVTAIAAIAVSVPLRNAALLALGAVAALGYVTGAAVLYLNRSLGVPAALGICGVMVVGLSVVTARLMRAVQPTQRPTLAGPGTGDASLPPRPEVP